MDVSSEPGAAATSLDVYFREFPRGIYVKREGGVVKTLWAAAASVTASTAKSGAELPDRDIGGRAEEREGRLAVTEHRQKGRPPAPASETLAAAVSD